jgi:hypothetical protein
LELRRNLNAPATQSRTGQGVILTPIMKRGLRPSIGALLYPARYQNRFFLRAGLTAAFFAKRGGVSGLGSHSGVC